ncbi:MAG: nucleotide exchange factor GrpE [bacterium]
MSKEKDETVFDNEDNNLDDSVLEEESQVEVTKKLRGKLKNAETKAREYLDGWQRSKADFINLRKRDEDEKVEFLKFANLGLVGELIPVLDSFNIAIAGGHKDVEPIYNQLKQVLTQTGLEELNPLGQQFNPRLHESVGVVETEKEKEEHMVLDVVQNGYSYAGRVIRPAKVRVGEFIKNK